MPAGGLLYQNLHKKKQWAAPHFTSFLSEEGHSELVFT